jgi:hypothetical protein
MSGPPHAPAALPPGKQLPVPTKAEAGKEVWPETVWTFWQDPLRPPGFKTHITQPTN